MGGRGKTQAMAAPVDLIRFIFTSPASRYLRRICKDLIPFGRPQRQSSPCLPPSLWRVTVGQVRDLRLDPPPSLSRSPGSPPSLSISIRPVPIPSPLPSRPPHSLSPCLSFSIRPSSLSLRLDPSRPAPCSARTVLSVSLLPVGGVWCANFILHARVALDSPIWLDKKMAEE
ncbi:hypothetical protein ACLOJK_003384 [Asimina triloba]